MIITNVIPNIRIRFCAYAICQAVAKDKGYEVAFYVAEYAEPSLVCQYLC